MQLRKLWNLGAALMLGLAVTACGDSGSTTPDSGSDAPVSDTQRDTTVDLTSDFFVPNPDGAADGPAIDAPLTDGPLTDGPVADGPSNDSAGGDNQFCSNATPLTWSGSPVIVQVDTTGTNDDIDVPAGTCNLSDGSPGPDRFYSISLPPGSYTARLESLFDPALYVLASCSPAACLGGSDIPDVAETEEVMINAISSPTTTFIIGVDSYDGSEFGPSTLTIFENSNPPDAGVPDTGAMDAGVPDGPVPDAPATDGPVADAPATDGPAADAGVQPDAGSTPTVVISEMLANPNDVTDANGEWFEVYNPGSSPVDLQGWTIKDDGSDSHVIGSSVVVPPGGYIVLGRNANTGQNGDVNLAYAYGSDITLGNGTDELVLLNPAQVEVDRVNWTSAWVTAGASISLPVLTADNNVMANWCTEVATWSGATTNLGTPGQAAGCTVP